MCCVVAVPCSFHKVGQVLGSKPNVLIKHSDASIILNKFIQALTEMDQHILYSPYYGNEDMRRGIMA